ncbi:hypothetical protein LSH36_533g01063 [Paralvinella palmiformis]|uniref:Suppressor of forked domain-containing protein n=1 Tax=Paralvinella palmiformis TaxID=53620 RepID=A0AAD9J7I4_9ANNE|nr:hypothetical protein LSH36_533g01063 [Paralvinella palmiformis]
MLHPYLLRIHPEELKQVELWKKYIAFEKSNPLRTEDQGLIARRVMFAYEQCLLCLGHHPDVWIEAAAYLEHSSRILTEKGDQNTGKLFADEASAMYERAVTTLLKNNMLVYFAYADFEESRMKHQKCHSIYRKLIQCSDIDPTLAYILYMRFARRAEGIKSARQVFKLAREDGRSRWQVFVAAALMEYYCSKDKSVAFKIFELGLKKYGEFPEYVKAYVEFMSHVNEDNNTRVLYERVLGSGQLPADKQHEIWNRFLEFESEVGDLASIVKVEKRRSQIIGKEFEGRDTALLIDRYRYLDLLPCTPLELKTIGYTKVVLDGDDFDRPNFPMPDTSQMLPYKPRPNVVPGSHPVPGGIFPPPPAATELMTKLPPPQCFKGPYVIIDRFIEHMSRLRIPDVSEIVKVENGIGSRCVDEGTKLSFDIAAGRKRKLENNDDSDDEDSNKAPPTHDIYRSRQQKKVIK